MHNRLRLFLILGLLCLLPALAFPQAVVGTGGFAGTAGVKVYANSTSTGVAWTTPSMGAWGAVSPISQDDVFTLNGSNAAVFGSAHTYEMLAVNANIMAALTSQDYDLSFDFKMPASTLPGQFAVHVRSSGASLTPTAVYNANASYWGGYRATDGTGGFSLWKGQSTTGYLVHLNYTIANNKVYTVRVAGTGTTSLALALYVIDATPLSPTLGYYLNSSGAFVNTTVACLTTTDATPYSTGKGWPGFWAQGAGSVGLTVSNGVLRDLSGGGALTAGTLTLGTTTANSVPLSWGNASGGTSPYTYDVQRAADSAFTSGLTTVQAGATSPTADNTVSGAYDWYYRTKVTDAASTVTYTNFVHAVPPQNATGYTVTPSPPNNSSVSVGSTISFPISFVTGSTLTNSLSIVVTPGSGLTGNFGTTTAGATISGNTLTVASGSYPTGVNLTFIPTNAVTGAQFTFVHSGGGGSFLSGNEAGPFTYNTQTSATINFSDPNLFNVAGGWYLPGDGSGRCNVPGNYVKFGFHSTISGNVTINLDTTMYGGSNHISLANISLAYAIDGGAWQIATLDTIINTNSNRLFTGVAAGDHNVIVVLNLMQTSDNTFDRWGSALVDPVAVLRITSFSLPAGTTTQMVTGPYAIRPLRALFYGDSILICDTGVQGHISSGPIFAQGWTMMQAMNAEAAFAGAGGVGFAHPGGGGNNSFPNIYDSTGATTGFLLTFDGTNTHTRLTNGGQLPAYNLIAVLLGTNDAGEGAPLLANIQGVMTQLSLYCPGAKKFMVIPFGSGIQGGGNFSTTYPADGVTFAQAQISNAFAASQTATPDPNWYLIDPDQNARANSGATDNSVATMMHWPSSDTANSLMFNYKHPTAPGQAAMGANTAAAIQQAQGVMTTTTTIKFIRSSRSVSRQEGRN